MSGMGVARIAARSGGTVTQPQVVALAGKEGRVPDGDAIIENAVRGG